MQYQKESVDQCQANLDLMVFDTMLESVSYASIFQVCMEHVYTFLQCPSRLIQSTYIGFQHVNSFWYINQSILWWNIIFKNENWNFNEQNDCVCVRILYVNAILCIPRFTISDSYIIYSIKNNLESFLQRWP